MAQQRARTTSVKTTKPLSAKERGEKATESLRQALGIPLVQGDAAVFGAALAEIAVEESRYNARFASAVRERYQELMAQQPTPKSVSAKQKPDLPPLVLIHRVEGYRADPFSPPNPRLLIHMYGVHQLDRALQDYTLDMLKDTAAKVQSEHPGTKPRSKASKQSVIDYIVQYSGLSD
ncbi:MAG: hypothetical protein ACLQUY_21465 [Ktedonobacterales bacterium]